MSFKFTGFDRLKKQTPRNTSVFITCRNSTLWRDNFQSNSSGNESIKNLFHNIHKNSHLLLWTNPFRNNSSTWLSFMPTGILSKKFLGFLGNAICKFIGFRQVTQNFSFVLVLCSRAVPSNGQKRTRDYFWPMFPPDGVLLPKIVDLVD